MAIASLCNICGRATPSLRSCNFCGSVVCTSCIDTKLGICKKCKGGVKR